jgi:DNA-binding MarR family transcriptional regulator
MMSKRQPVVKSGSDDFSLLVGDIYEAAAALRQRGDALAAMEGQSQARWQTMAAFADRPMTVPQAARRLGVTRQGVQRVVNDLLEAGLLHAVSNPDHRSSPLLELTPEGSACLNRINARAHNFHDTLSPTFNLRQITDTRKALQSLIAAINAS